jgi:hypothetical protein
MDYELLQPEQQAEILRDRLRLLESEHYGLSRGFSTIPHAVVHMEGETAEEALARMRKERLPEIEKEVKGLRIELKSAEDGTL